MAQSLDRLKESASQTAGPYVHIGLTPSFCDIPGIYSEDLGRTLISSDTKGERITVNMRVLDGTGMAIRDVLVETWQADADGIYPAKQEPRGKADPAFTGWGRIPSDMESGLMSFETIKPGPVSFGDGRLQAPHITLWIVARGINLGLHTRMYFSDEEKANAQDPVLTRIEHQNRVETLIARKDGDAYHFDIHLQGDKETVFFDV